MSTENAPQKQSRHPGKRLSPWRVSSAVVVVLAVVGAAVVVPLALNNEANAEPAVASGPRWFGGYFDVTAAPASTKPDLTSGGPANVVLAFVVAESPDSCVPTWGTYYGLDEAANDLDLDRRIARMRQEGADVAVSFGGALNTELAAACDSVGDLAAAYKKVIDRYDVSTIDLDIEGENLTNTAAGTRRAQALAQLQQSNSDLGVWLTLPVATTGLTDQGLAVVDQMLAAEVDLAGVNVMTMDYGTDLEGDSMADAAESALTATAEQLTTLYKRRDVSFPAEGAWGVLGATPMIGQNDVAGEVFTIEDAEQLNAFATAQSLERLSMWSLNRDRTCGPNYPNLTVVSDSCSGVDQGGATFAGVLASGYTGRPVSPTATSTPTPPPVITDDPATSPYPIWSPDLSYSYGVRVVWHGNVYQAKWWTQGGAAPDDPTVDGNETAWTLVGPVLESDQPFALPTVAPGTYPDWTGDQVYVAGDRVLVSGTPFVAKWWTQGDNPMDGITDNDRSPWKLVTDEPTG